MSYPPDPNATQPYGQQPPPQQPGYGYPAPPQGAPGYGYPPQGTVPPGGMPPGGQWGAAPASMPGTVITARVLLFVMGGFWSIGAVALLVLALTVQNAVSSLGGPMEDLGNLTAGLAVFIGLLAAAMAALAIVPAAMFGSGSTGTRVTAIIAASVNTLLAVISLGGDSPVMGLLWLATAVLTIVFCGQRQAGEWFGRPRY
ncbi:hypothetical protein GCM10009716_15720 [Streptomyces sodiiphilus]|uniref:Integral membrane protein n=1 Tax=Streptomyces sodiiphilus TaxID=226217 RepID=A0ABN2NXP6_9ACTN